MKKGLERLAFAALLVFGLKTFSDNQADVDLWGNVGFVTAPPWSADFHWTNTFSFTATDHPWINHEWLAQYIFHETWKHFGNAGLLGLKVSIGLALIALWNRSMKLNNVGWPVRFLFLCLVISTTGYGFSTRPHLWSYLMLSIFLLLLQRWRHLPLPAFLALPALGWLWANMHGAFFIGLAVCAVFIIAELPAILRSGSTQAAERHNFAALWAATIAFACLSLATPYGLDLWRFIADSFGKPRPYLSEWGAFSIRLFSEHADFIALACLAVPAIFIPRTGAPTASLIITALSFASALVLRRQIPVFAIASVYSAPAVLQKITERSLPALASGMPKWIPAVFLAAFTAVSAAYPAITRRHPLEIEVNPDRFPVQIIAFMRESHMKGNVLVFFDWAEQVIWHCHPNCRVFLDGRFSDAYDNRTINDYLRLLSGAGDWRKILSGYPVNIMLLHTDLPIAPAVAADPEWLIAASNSYALLLVRKSHPANAGVPASGIGHATGENDTFHPIFP